MVWYYGRVNKLRHTIGLTALQVVLFLMSAVALLVGHQRDRPQSLSHPANQNL